MNKTTVIHIIGDANLSGVPVHVLTLATELKGLRQVVIGPDGEAVTRFKAAKVPYVVVPMRSKFDRAAISRLTEEISDIAVKEKDVIVHCHGVRAGFLGRLAVRSLGLPVIYTEHSWTNDYHLPHRLNEWFQVAMLRWLDRYTIKTVAVSQATADFLIGQHITTTDKVVTIPHGLHMSKKRLPLSDGYVIGSVGSLTWQKNYEWLIKLMVDVRKQLPQTVLEIAGAGPQHAELQRLINELDLNKNVQLLGSVSDNKLKECYARWTLYVQPSVNESFGLAAAEAMAAGLLVVASSRGSLPELLGAPDTLFDLDQPTKAAELLVALLKNKKMRTAIYEQQGEHIKKFELNKMLAAYTELYKEFVSA